MAESTFSAGPVVGLLADKVYERLLGLIGTPGFEPQARMPGETALSRQLGVSRPVLRQALARLRDEGRIAARKGSGTFVTDMLPQAAALSIRTLQDIPDIRAFLEFRLCMEGEAAARAAQVRTGSQLQDVRDCCERFERALAEGRDAVDEDIAFHEAIAQGCGNRFFAMTMSALAPQTRFSIQLARQLSGRAAGDRPSGVCAEHRAVVDAIARQDPLAARASMEAHLRGGIARLFGSQPPA
ncbi:FadR/GntR family transcriptional regulator [Xylophilus sp. GOD-11R]|uniref:FadR/GntR family transcriptional regulator n=1 Tax=Xylophilus sp. GOD-11R TaxID=3089814 RepID=UPI00298C828F|nr:FadR/GntR family transcriptional regulator [Xylophilus sp. GOD-11R]WPB58292.1 FadR/GntR family transcriptional regulator [Xylophilus sp. GOD-11R]